MLTMTLEVKNDYLITAFQEQLKRAPEVVRVEVDRAVNEVGELALAGYRREPGPVVYPLQWESVRQRKAFFATRGFGRGIGAPRTHKLNQAYKLRVIYTPGQITSVEVTNDDPGWEFVKGPRQQKFHQVTGWTPDADTSQVAEELLADNVENGLIRSFYAIG